MMKPLRTLCAEERMPGAAAWRLMSLLLVLCSAASSYAAPPPATVTWVTPTGTARADEPIDLWLRLTVDAAASQALVLDGTPANFSLVQDLPDFASVSSVVSQSWLGCENSFIPGGCNEPDSAYVYTFNLGADTFNPYSGGLPVPLGITMLPGQTRDFLVTTFMPRAGQVPAGLYSLDIAGLQLLVKGLDHEGRSIERVVGLGDTCSSSPGCQAFERQVSAVPEPATSWLMLAGAALFAARRRWPRVGPQRL